MLKNFSSLVWLPNVSDNFCKDLNNKFLIHHYYIPLLGPISREPPLLQLCFQLHLEYKT
jgi:hypothetical protein